MDKTLMFRCERCGRQAGVPMLDCPERQLGSCIYTLQRNQSNRSGGYILLAMVIGSACLDVLLLVFLRLWLRSDLPLAGWLFMASIFLSVTVLLLAFWAYLTFSEELTLYNAETGQMWQRRSLGRLEIRQATTSRLEPLPLDAYLNLALHWPASLSALLAETPPPAGLDTPENKSSLFSRLATLANHPSAYLVEAALLGLLADQRITLYQAQAQRSYLGRSPTRVVEYFVKPGEAGKQGAQGWLEQRILYVVNHWAPGKDARDWPQGAPIFHLVRAIYTCDQTSPGEWLVRQVQADAVKCGLGTLQGTLRRHFEPAPDLTAQLAGEARSVRAVYGQIGRVFPLVIRTLDTQVRRGIASRQLNTG